MLEIKNTPKKLIVTITSTEGRYNYHNAGPITLHIDHDMYAAGTIELTPSQDKRLRNHYCPCDDCCCGSTPAEYIPARGYDYDNIVGCLQSDLIPPNQIAKVLIGRLALRRLINRFSDNTKHEKRI